MGVGQSTPECDSLEGKTVLITGGNTGLGKETARCLALRGAKVIIACRDVAKGEEAAKEIAAVDPNKITNVVVKKLDLASLSSVRKFAEDILIYEEKIDVLINNAGVAACPRWLTEDGFEMQFGVNHLGHFALTLLLLDRLKYSVPSRIVNVASIAHYVGQIHFDDINLEKDYTPLKAYEQSKLANILFTRELAKRLEGTGVTTYSLHPGAVNTDLGRHMATSMGRSIGALFDFVSKFFFKTVQQGAQTIIYCATNKSIPNDSGYYYSNCKRVEPSSKAKDDKAAQQLWELSEKLTGVYIN